MEIRMAVSCGNQGLNLPNSWWKSRAQLAQNPIPVTSEYKRIWGSNLLFHNYFRLREFSEPDVFSVLNTPKWISPPRVFVQPLPKPTQTLCTYGGVSSLPSQLFLVLFCTKFLLALFAGSYFFYWKKQLIFLNFLFAIVISHIQISSSYSYFIFSEGWSCPACSFSQSYGRFPQIWSFMIIFPEPPPKIGDQEKQ